MVVVFLVGTVMLLLDDRDAYVAVGMGSFRCLRCQLALSLDVLMESVVLMTIYPGNIFL